MSHHNQLSNKSTPSMPGRVIDKNYWILKPDWILIIVIILGFVLRFLVGLRGFNFDFNSYLVVVNLLENGENVYANTTRYNYGPIWFNILHFINFIASDNPGIFRYLLIFFLSIVDFSICFILLKRFGRRSAFLFFLNPISIIISGYHNQFDNLALLTGMIAVLVVGNDFNQPVRKRKLIGLVLLGVSLATKHILFAFPFWLAIKQKGFFQKLLIMLIPVLTFILSFLPYWHEGKDGIIRNIFLYKSFNNECFYFLFIPNLIQKALSSMVVWIIFLIGFALFFRKKSGFESLLLYLCILVTTSPSIANQYLVIPLPYLITNMNPFFLFYNILGSVYLIADEAGLHFTMVKNLLANSPPIPFYDIFVAVLLSGFIWNHWREQIIGILKRIFIEIKLQFVSDTVDK